LADRTKSVAARVLKDAGLTVVGYQLSKLFPEAKGLNNLAAATRMIHHAVNESLGIGKNERNEPNADDMENALNELDKTGDGIVQKIKDAQG
jgi:DNA repair protein RadD